MIPTGWGWDQRPRSLAVAGPKTRPVWGQWRAVGDPEPWGFADTSWAPSAGFLPPFLRGHSGEGPCRHTHWLRSAGRARFPRGRGSGTASAAAARPPASRQPGHAGPRPHWSRSSLGGEGEAQRCCTCLVCCCCCFPEKSLIQKQYFGFSLCSVSAKVTCCVKYPKRSLAFILILRNLRIGCCWFFFFRANFFCSITEFFS